ncbi:hypothetical protein [Embleya sp. AB8]|uniref:hypothetical protein n=1 Tax=Embleya sp. AB8 TaxID=3156304 RepID=UPI003C71D798
MATEIPDPSVTVLPGIGRPGVVQLVVEGAMSAHRRRLSGPVTVSMSLEAATSVVDHIVQCLPLEEQRRVARHVLARVGAATGAVYGGPPPTPEQCAALIADGLALIASCRNDIREDGGPHGSAEVPQRTDIESSRLVAGDG